MYELLTQPSTSRYIITVLFLITGLLHFLKPAPFVNIVPDFLPAHEMLVYISGVAEIVGGIGLILRATQQWAAWGLLALLVAVFPANVNMSIQAVHHQGWGGLYTWATIFRLPLQFVLMYWICWAALK